MEQNFTIDALRSLGHNIFTIVDGVITIEKDGAMVELTSAQKTKLDAEVVVMKNYYNSMEYSRLRKAEYDKLNQDELRFDDEVNKTSTWVDTILAIKAQFPKS